VQVELKDKTQYKLQIQFEIKQILNAKMLATRYDVKPSVKVHIKEYCFAFICLFFFSLHLKCLDSFYYFSFFYLFFFLLLVGLCFVFLNC